MKEQFVSYKIALKLKELGFDEPCFAHWNNDKDFIIKPAIQSSTQLYYCQNNINPNNQYNKCTAPLYQQVEKFFRHKGFKFQIIEGENTCNYYYEINNFSNKYNPKKWYDTYELSREACFEDIIEEFKNKTK